VGGLASGEPTAVVDLGDDDVVGLLRAGDLAGRIAAAPALCEAADPETLALPGPWRLLRPIVPAESWASGVTYERSRDARISESVAQDVYALVYEADRPELFMKDAAGRRTVGPGAAVGVRSDSVWTVPEPELALVVGQDGALLGATVANDVTARDVEGANPLYLPQAKLFGAALSLGPAILVPDDWDEPFAIELHLYGPDGALVHADETSTARMVRTYDHLVGYLLRDNPVPDGTVLLTGAGVVPPDDVALAAGQRVEVRIPGIGVLANPVISAADAGAVTDG